MGHPVEAPVLQLPGLKESVEVSMLQLVRAKSHPHLGLHRSEMFQDVSWMLNQIRIWGVGIRVDFKSSVCSVAGPVVLMCGSLLLGRTIANGTWSAIIFGWVVHAELYPLERQKPSVSQLNSALQHDVRSYNLHMSVVLMVWLICVYEHL